MSLLFLQVRALLLGALLLTIPVSSLAMDGDSDAITFIHLNDLHANLTPHRDLVRSSTKPPLAVIERRGGLAKIATLIKTIRAESQHSILMNIGDTYHGGVEAIYTRGNAIVAPVDALGIDIGVPGNWDFAYGPVTTRLRYSDTDSAVWELINNIMFDSDVLTPDYPLLGGNVTKTAWLIDDGEALLPATKILQIGKRRVGFIGITSDIIPRMSPMLAWGFEFLQGEAAYRNYVDKHSSALRAQGVDLVVVMSELGLHKDRQLADVVAAGVDIFFSAHTHELTPQPILSSSGALVVEAGNDGVLGLMRVSFDRQDQALFEWKIVAVDDTVAEDPDVLALVDAARAPFLVADPDLSFPMPRASLHLSESIDTTVGNAPTLLHRRQALENPFNSYLADRLREHYHTDVAITPGFRFDAVVPAGTAMTLEEAYRYLPAPPTLARGTVTAKRLREIFEQELTRAFSRDAFKHSGGWLLGVSGITITLDLDAEDGAMIVEMRRLSDGSLLAPEDTLSILSCLRPFDASDELCGNGGFDDIESVASPGGDSWAAVEFLSWVLSQPQSKTIRSTAITDIAATPLWPDTPYVQPLRSPVRQAD